MQPRNQKVSNAKGKPKSMEYKHETKRNALEVGNQNIFNSSKQAKDIHFKKETQGMQCNKKVSDASRKPECIKCKQQQ